jgi:pyridinium-3,5-bisthiocarboxylic acid mononucleotide nickel chelatase
VRLAYFDCIAGISGDMALGALVDAGADAERMRAVLTALPLEPFEFELQEVETGGLRALRATVHPLAGGVIRTYASIRALLDTAELDPGVRNTAQRIFRRLAEAEATVHRREVETVTFHEVGAVDSIVDIVGVSLALEDLGVERVFASAVPTGMGMVRTEHGLLPVPAPAVTELLRGVPVYSGGATAELTTPTGAAILASVAEGFGEMPHMRIEATGYGAGTHELAFPNVLRVLIGEEAPAVARGRRDEPGGRGGPGDLVLETNVDDLNPELYGFVLERLLEAGAQDAWLTPIVMKKGRAAVTISVLCSTERERALRQVLFRETGTLGVRTSRVEKHALDREVVQVETPHGTVGVKVGYLEGRAVTLAPEYEDCARVAREAGVPAREVYREALRLAHEQLELP